MAAWDRKIFWCIMLLVTGAEAAGGGVNYPDPVCAVEGSTVTILCTFTPVLDGDKPSQVVRVIWCQNHEICQGTTPNVYNSTSKSNDPRFKYLGDKKSNCSLQITDVQKKDNGSFHFRIEAEPKKFSFSGRTGVKVSVPDVVQMEIKNSSADGLMRGGQNISLLCTTRTCSIHQLKFTWFQDGRTLPESGSTLRINSLTAEHSGNYTCGLTGKASSVSLPYSLWVEEEGGAGGAVGAGGAGGAGGDELPLIIGAVFGSLLLVFTLTLVVCIIRRRRRSQKAAGDLKRPAVEEDVSYASVQFQQKNQIVRAAKKDDDAVIYSSVTRRS